MQFVILFIFQLSSIFFVCASPNSKWGVCRPLIKLIEIFGDGLVWMLVPVAFLIVTEEKWLIEFCVNILAGKSFFLTWKISYLEAKYCKRFDGPDLTYAYVYYMYCNIIICLANDPFTYVKNLLFFSSSFFYPIINCTIGNSAQINKFLQLCFRISCFL